MMDLTPLDVRKKPEDFRRTLRGYDPAQVDAFLDLVADRLQELTARATRLSEQTELLREQLDAFQERERALNDALVTAQELREEARTQAEKAADLRLREAEREATQLRREAELDVRASREALDELRARRAGFLRSVRTSLERFLAEVAAEEERLEAEVASAVGRRERYRDEPASSGEAGTDLGDAEPPGPVEEGEGGAP
jgi:DivIVA domain-containing protein